MKITLCYCSSALNETEKQQNINFSIFHNLVSGYLFINLIVMKCTRNS